MFSEVIAKAKEYTRPVVILYRFTDGRLESNIGTFFHVDDFGHILSASHIFKMGSEDPISSISLIFDGRYFNAEYIADDVHNDIILLKIKDYVPGSIKLFPRFLKGSTGELQQGTPLVRLGFPKGNPYSNIPLLWNEVSNSFMVDEKHSRITCFYNGGLVTQYVNRENQVRLLEISTPALLGQSGGPLLSVDGTVVGLQSRNTILEFPFRKPVETGLAASHIVIAKFLEDNPTVRTAWM